MNSLVISKSLANKQKFRTPKVEKFSPTFNDIMREAAAECEIEDDKADIRQ